MARGTAREGVTRDTLLTAPLFSEELDIALARQTEPELFKWFLASLLYGARMLGAIAAHTYRAFERHGLLSPEAILAAGWDRLVTVVMREGHYVRYDESKSRQILRDCQTLLDDYGSVGRIHESAADPRDLERRLDALYGVGPVTANIFLRELRPWWPKADPAPLPAVVEEADRLGIDLEGLDRKSLDFVRLESGLLHLRLGRARKRPPPGPVLWLPPPPDAETLR